jgi:hypothetical protein
MRMPAASIDPGAVRRFGALAAMTNRRRSRSDTAARARCSVRDDRRGTRASDARDTAPACAACARPARRIRSALPTHRRPVRGPWDWPARRAVRTRRRTARSGRFRSSGSARRDSPAHSNGTAAHHVGSWAPAASRSTMSVGIIEPFIDRVEPLKSVSPFFVVRRGWGVVQEAAVVADPIIHLRAGAAAGPRSIRGTLASPPERDESKTHSRTVPR